MSSAELKLIIVIDPEPQRNAVWAPQKGCGSFLLYTGSLILGATSKFCTRYEDLSDLILKFKAM
jgi:hypothetical protein